MHFEISQDTLTTFLVVFGIWIVRLESKVRSQERDMNGLGSKFYKMQSEQHKDLTDIKISLAKVETKLGIKDEKVNA